jgi:hypothetical protein
MGRPKSTDRYPPQYIDILELLREDPKTPVKMLYNTRAAAKNEQLNFLAFKSAAEKESWHRDVEVTLIPEHPGDAKRTVLTKAQFPELLAYVTRVRENEHNHWVFEVWHMDYTPESLDRQGQIEAIRAERAKQ